MFFSLHFQSTMVITVDVDGDNQRRQEKSVHMYETGADGCWPSNECCNIAEFTMRHNEEYLLINSTTPPVPVYKNYLETNMIDAVNGADTQICLNVRLWMRGMTLKVDAGTPLYLLVKLGCIKVTTLRLTRRQQKTVGESPSKLIFVCFRKKEKNGHWNCDHI